MAGREKTPPPNQALPLLNLQPELCPHSMSDSQRKLMEIHTRQVKLISSPRSSFSSQPGPRAPSHLLWSPLYVRPGAPAVFHPPPAPFTP